MSFQKYFNKHWVLPIQSKTSNLFVHRAFKTSLNYRASLTSHVRQITCRVQEGGGLNLSVTLTNSFSGDGFCPFHSPLYSSGTEKPIFLYKQANNQTYELTNQLTNFLKQSTSDDLTVPQLVTKLPAYYGNPRSIITFTKVCNMSLHKVRLILSCPPPISVRFTLILSFHPCLSLPSSLFP